MNQQQRKYFCKELNRIAKAAQGKLGTQLQDALDKIKPLATRVSEYLENEPEKAAASLLKAAKAVMSTPTTYGKIVDLCAYYNGDPAGIWPVAVEFKSKILEEKELIRNKYAKLKEKVQQKTYEVEREVMLKELPDDVIKALSDFQKTVTKITGVSADE